MTFLRQNDQKRQKAAFLTLRQYTKIYEKLKNSGNQKVFDLKLSPTSEKLSKIDKKSTIFTGFSMIFEFFDTKIPSFEIYDRHFWAGFVRF